MDADDPLCYCFHISRRKIVNYVKRERPSRASMISQCFGAGSGCGWCIPYLIRLHEKLMKDATLDADDISSEDYESMRLDYLKELREGARDRNRLPGAPEPADLDDFLDDL